MSTLIMIVCQVHAAFQDNEDFISSFMRKNDLPEGCAVGSTILNNGTKEAVLCYTGTAEQAMDLMDDWRRHFHSQGCPVDVCDSCITAFVVEKQPIIRH